MKLYPLPNVWSPEITTGLAGTFGNAEAYLRSLVEANKAQLWITSNQSYLMTEYLPEQSELFIWCFKGKGALPLWLSLARVAQRLRFTHMGCFTRHKAASWLFRKYNPEISISSVDGADEYRIRISVQELLSYDCRGTISSAPHEKSVEPPWGRLSAAN